MCKIICEFFKYSLILWQRPYLHTFEKRKIKSFIKKDTHQMSLTDDILLHENRRSSQKKTRRDETLRLAEFNRFCNEKAQRLKCIEISDKVNIAPYLFCHIKVQTKRKLFRFDTVSRSLRG